MKKLSENDRRIGNRVVRSLSKIQGSVTRKSFAEAAGFDPSHFYRLLKGQHHWKMDQVDRVVKMFKRYGVNVSRDELLGSREDQVRIVAETSNNQFKRHYHFDNDHDFGLIDIKSLVHDFPKKDISLYYGIRIVGDRMFPMFKSGDVLIARKADPEEIKNGDKIIFNDGELSHITWIERGTNQDILHPFSLVQKPLYFNHGHAPHNLDKIIVIISS